MNGSKDERVETSMVEGLFGAPPVLPTEDKRVCQKCGRFFYEGYDTLDDWLIGRVTYQQPNPVKRRVAEWVIRCPQHINLWGLRITGRGVSTWMRKLAEDARLRDLERFVPKNPYMTPYPSPANWSE